MKNVVLVLSLIVNIVLALYVETYRASIESAYNRAVWETCLYGLVNQSRGNSNSAVLREIRQTCREQYYERAITENWYEDQDWPSVSE